jgi:hypothetical protein
MTNIRQTALLRHPAGLAPEVSCAGTSDVTRRRFFTAPWPRQPAPGVPQAPHCMVARSACLGLRTRSTILRCSCRRRAHISQALRFTSACSARQFAVNGTRRILTPPAAGLRHCRWLLRQLFGLRK